MIAVIRRVHGGQLDEKMEILGQDELGELADAYNRMSGVLRRHRELETTLAQQGKMASLGVLSSGVAHEINNPLGVILGYAAYLEKKLDPDDPNLKYIQEIKRESKRSKKIVQDLLSYSRVPRPSPEKVDLNSLLDQIVEFASQHPELATTAFEKDLAPDVGTIAADADQLRQVAINLIFNAGAAMPEGGKVTVGTRKRDDTRVEMWIKDTGVGMTEEVRERIFEPFFTTRPQGTGLGLAIARQIVERHRGSIEVETAPGQGTTVRVVLPSVQEEF
jgi:two-component system NtrC family sensor kinase